MPTARAFWAMRTMAPSTSLLVIIRSASSSMMKTMYGSLRGTRAACSSVLWPSRSLISSQSRSL